MKMVNLKNVSCANFMAVALKPHVTVIVAYYHSVESICMLFAVSAVTYPLSEKNDCKMYHMIHKLFYVYQRMKLYYTMKEIE